jgi:hypothetical protein
MHTVVFGWFGGSAIWFIPLFWRLVMSVLPGGAGLRGPGTIRLWLGFVCVMLASCTLEASLISVTGINGFGHALAAGLGHLLGHIGTPFAALALFLISLPWLIDFRWRDFAAWADGAFGLGLSRGLAKRDEDARRHRSVDDGAPSHVSPATNTMAPKSNGRYARPTVWRPPASGRAATGAGGAGGAGGLAASKDASARSAGANWRTGAAAPRSQTTQTEPVLRTGTTTTGRQVPMHPMNADNAPFMPAEPVAPAGWLRDPVPRASVSASAGGPTVGLAASAASARDAALQFGRRTPGEQRWWRGFYLDFGSCGGCYRGGRSRENRTRLDSGARCVWRAIQRGRVDGEDCTGCKPFVVHSGLACGCDGSGQPRAGTSPTVSGHATRGRCHLGIGHAAADAGLHAANGDNPDSRARGECPGNASQHRGKHRALDRSGRCEPRA